MLSRISTKRKGVEALFGITDLRYQQKISIILHVGSNMTPLPYIGNVYTMVCDSMVSIYF